MAGPNEKPPILLPEADELASALVSALLHDKGGNLVDAERFNEEGLAIPHRVYLDGEFDVRALAELVIAALRTSPGSS